MFSIKLSEDFINGQYKLYRRRLPCQKFLRALFHQTTSTLECVKKKDVSSSMPSSPNPAEIESGWYEWWESRNFFRRIDSSKKFVMILPPPNVTGKLHMGHALTIAIQDALVRRNQIAGCHVVWVPGYDHAGIATQVVVEKHLWDTRKLTRHDLGREQFLNEVNRWKDDKIASISEQLRKMGAALDWDRSIFTMDKNISKAVTEAVIRLFDGGYMYRGKYMVNWCSALQSAISDSEVEHLHLEGPTKIKVPGYDGLVEFGKMYDVAYQIKDSDIFTCQRKYSIDNYTRRKERII